MFLLKAKGTDNYFWIGEQSHKDLSPPPYGIGPIEKASRFNTEKELWKKARQLKSAVPMLASQTEVEEVL